MTREIVHHMKGTPHLVLGYYFLANPRSDLISLSSSLHAKVILYTVLEAKGRVDQADEYLGVFMI